MKNPVLPHGVLLLSCWRAGKGHFEFHVIDLKANIFRSSPLFGAGHRMFVLQVSFSRIEAFSREPLLPPIGKPYLLKNLNKGLYVCMGRYCIICNKLFGCIKGKVRHVCQDCECTDLCNMPDHFAMSQITGGICDHCWESRKALKTVINK